MSTGISFVNVKSMAMDCDNKSVLQVLVLQLTAPVATCKPAGRKHLLSAAD